MVGADGAIDAKLVANMIMSLTGNATGNDQGATDFKEKIHEGVMGSMVMPIVLTALFAVAAIAMSFVVCCCLRTKEGKDKDVKSKTVRAEAGTDTKTTTREGKTSRRKEEEEGEGGERKKACLLLALLVVLVLCALIALGVAVYTILTMMPHMSDMKGAVGKQIDDMESEMTRLYCGLNSSVTITYKDMSTEERVAAVAAEAKVLKELIPQLDTLLPPYIEKIKAMGQIDLCGSKNQRPCKDVFNGIFDNMAWINENGDGFSLYYYTASLSYQYKETLQVTKGGYNDTLNGFHGLDALIADDVPAAVKRIRQLMSKITFNVVPQRDLVSGFIEALAEQSNKTTAIIKANAQLMGALNVAEREGSKYERELLRSYVVRDNIYVALRALLDSLEGKRQTSVENVLALLEAKKLLLVEKSKTAAAVHEKLEKNFEDLKKIDLCLDRATRTACTRHFRMKEFEKEPVQWLSMINGEIKQLQQRNVHLNNVPGLVSEIRGIDLPSQKAIVGKVMSLSDLYDVEAAKGDIDESFSEIPQYYFYSTGIVSALACGLSIALLVSVTPLCNMAANKLRVLSLLVAVASLLFVLVPALLFVAFSFMAASSSLTCNSIHTTDDALPVSQHVMSQMKLSSDSSHVGDMLGKCRRNELYVDMLRSMREGVFGSTGSVDGTNPVSPAPFRSTSLRLQQTATQIREGVSELAKPTIAMNRMFREGDEFNNPAFNSSKAAVKKSHADCEAAAVEATKAYLEVAEVIHSLIDALNNIVVTAPVVTETGGEYIIEPKLSTDLTKCGLTAIHDNSVSLVCPTFANIFAALATQQLFMMPYLLVLGMAGFLVARCWQDEESGVDESGKATAATPTNTQRAGPSAETSKRPVAASAEVASKRPGASVESSKKTAGTLGKSAETAATPNGRSAETAGTPVTPGTPKTSRRALGHSAEPAGSKPGTPKKSKEATPTPATPTKSKRV